MKITPWEVSGKLDYKKIIKQFGTQPITDSLLKRIKKHTKELHIFLTRKLFFSHRDLNWVLKKYEKGEKFYLYTGRGPSGKTHLGHLIPWIFTKWLQDKFDAKLYFQMTDDEKFLFNPELRLEETNMLAYENALDVIAIGFDPEKTFIFSNIDYAKTLYKEAIKVAKHITFSTARAVFGFSNSSNVGQIFFTSMQAVPAFLESIKQGKNIPCLIPHAIDQDAHFRVARDVLPKLGYYKPASIHCKFLPSLKGIDAKMSASDKKSVIFTTDSPKEVKEKIWQAFSGGGATLKEHREKGGNPEIDIACQYLYFMFEENDEKIKEIFEGYKKGVITTGEIKKYLIKKVIRFLKKHQKNREKARKKLHEFIVKD